MRKTRIELNDSVMDIAQKMSEGNPGALSVILRIFSEGGAIDTQDFAGGLGSLLRLDGLGVYGSKIWMLYKDVCSQDLVRLMAVVRANQLGMLSDDVLLASIDNYGRGIDVEDLLEKVKARLDGFDRPAPAAAPTETQS